jgi:hypothetical protein
MTETRESEIERLKNAIAELEAEIPQHETRQIELIAVRDAWLAPATAVVKRLITEERNTKPSKYRLNIVNGYATALIYVDDGSLKVGDDMREEYIQGWITTVSERIKDLRLDLENYRNELAELEESDHAN